MLRLLGLACLSAAILGCAAPQIPACSLTNVLQVGPTTAAADHAASAPGNQAQFQAVLAPHANNTGCAVPQVLLLVDAAWSLSDPVDAQISSAATGTNGLATCNNAASNPITVTAVNTANGVTQTATATLVCK